MSHPDKREQFATQVQENMDRMMNQLNAALQKDKLMLNFDAIAQECIRLKIESWDQLTIAELRERMRVARAEEQKMFKESRDAIQKSLEPHLGVKMAAVAVGKNKP